MKTTTILNELIETLKDGQEGFRTAAESVESTDLKSMLLEYSLQRSRFAAELQAVARIEGEHDPEDRGSVAGALHRGWMNLKSVLSSREDHAILAECERGEDSAVEQYEKALHELGLPGHVSSIIREQYIRIKAAHDRVRDLRDSLVVAK